MLFIYTSKIFKSHTGESSLVLDVIEDFKRANNSKLIQIIEVNGTHQFHMNEANDTSNFIINFLNIANEIQTSKKIISKL